MAESAGRLVVGTSGYEYNHWRERFYPKDLSKQNWFAYYARCFDTVEINNTFYRMPDAATFDHWRNRAPEGFQYALKFSRYGSHLKKLKNPEQSLETFMSGARCLEGHLGPILVQLPPGWRANPERLDRFLTEAPVDQRWVLEVRDEDWLRDEIYAVLREHGVALCIHDLLPDHPVVVTTDWTYLRFHGYDYGGSYSREYLEQQAKDIHHRLAEGHDVYAYFNNDEDAHAVYNALELKRCVAGLNGTG